MLAVLCNIQKNRLNEVQTRPLTGFPAPHEEPYDEARES